MVCRCAAATSYHHMPAQTRTGKMQLQSDCYHAQQFHVEVEKAVTVATAINAVEQKKKMEQLESKWRAKA